jgi:hypothetical protein
MQTLKHAVRFVKDSLRIKKPEKLMEKLLPASDKYEIGGY